jgi:hypothetical protein
MEPGNTPAALDEHGDAVRREHTANDSWGARDESVALALHAGAPGRSFENVRSVHLAHLREGSDVETE